MKQYNLSLVTRHSSLLCLALTLCAACGRSGPNPAPDGTVTLKVSGLWGGSVLPGKEARSVAQMAERSVFERFAALHPDIQFDTSVGLQLQGSASESGILMAMAGGTAGQILYVNYRTLDQFVRQGFLYPLDAYILDWVRAIRKLPPDAPLTMDETDPRRDLDLPPQTWQVIYTPGPDGKRHVYSLPYTKVVMALIYRRDLFRRAGLDPFRPPDTWAELKEYAYTLTDPVKGINGVAFAAGNSWHFVDFLWQAGGEVVTQGPDGIWRAQFNDMAAVTAVRFWRELLNTEKTVAGKRAPIAVRNGTYGQDFVEGKVGMILNYTSDLLLERSGDIDPDLIGIAPLPKGPTGIRAGELNSAMWGMNATIKEQWERDAAWEFIRFQASAEARRVRTRVFVEAGYARLVNPAYLEEFGYDEYLDDTPPGWLEANKEAFKYGKPEPYGKNCQTIYHVLKIPLDRVLTDPQAREKAFYKPGTPEYDRDTREILRIFDEGVKETNEKLLGVIPADKLRWQRKVAYAVVLVIAGLMGFFLVRFVRTFTIRTDEDVHRSSFIVHRSLTPWLFMSLALLSIALWAYYPLICGSVMAFQDYRVLGGSTFVGLDNFIEVFNQQTFYWALINTLLYVGLSLGLGFFIPILLAIMLDEIPKGKVVYRTIYYLPAVMSGLVVAFLWKWFYDPNPTGFLNTMLGLFGSEPRGWLNDPRLAMLCVVIPGIWAGAGPGSLIYLAALKSIPDEVYEAADLDGASALRKVFSVTLPSLKPLIIINFVGAFIGAFHAMQNIFVMTGGGPVNATHVIGIEIWLSAFAFLKFGYATAVAWILGALLIGFTVYQLRILREVRFTTAPR